MTRRATVWSLLAVAVAAWACTAPVWAYGQAGGTSVQVSGGGLAPGVTGGGLVIGAAALAMALGRRVGAWVSAVVAVGGGALVVVSAVTVRGRAASVLSGVAGDQLGVDRVDQVTVTAWPWVAVGVGAAGVVLGVAAAILVRGWTGPSTRHLAPTDVPGDLEAHGVADDGSGEGLVDPGDAWDALSRGEDPTQSGYSRPHRPTED